MKLLEELRRRLIGKKKKEKKILVSLAAGPHAEYLPYIKSRFAEYAKLHGYEFKIYTETLDPLRPIAWSKIRILQETLRDFDEVLWLDADLWICDLTKDLAKQINPDSEIAWVYHNYENQSHPNTGVMFLRRTPNISKLLDQAYSQKDLINHPWWDQAGFMRVLGLDSTIHPIGENQELKILPISETKLSNDWNSILEDRSKVPIFRHFAGENHAIRILLLSEYSGIPLAADFVRREIIFKFHSFDIILEQRDDLFKKITALENSLDQNKVKTDRNISKDVTES